MSSKDYTENARQYYALLQQGMSPQQAFAQAFPDGIPNKQDQQKAMAAAQNKAAMGQVGGTVVGAVGINYLVNALTGKEAAKKVGEEVVKNTVKDEAAKQVTQQATQQAGEQAAEQGASQLTTQAGAEAAPNFSGSAVMGNFGQLGIGPQALITADAVASADSAYKTLVKGEKPGLEADASWGTNPVTAPFYWPLKWSGALGHKSTKQVQGEHTADLANMDKGNAGWMNYLNGMRGEQWQKGDSDHAYANKYDSWDEYKKAGLEAADLTGVYGNLKTYGPDWAKLNFDQQKAITQANIDAGNYDSSKGDVYLKDQNLAQALYQKVMGGAQPQDSGAVPAKGSVPGQGLVAALQGMTKPLPQKIDAGTLRRWRLNG